MIESKMLQSNRLRLDASKWEPGEWNRELDFYAFSWGDIYNYYIFRHDLGFFNGYVEIPSHHPLFKIRYQNYADHPNVHGAITFSGYLPDIYIEFIKYPRLKNEWLIGFDCAHTTDWIPYVGNIHVPRYAQHTTYKNIDFAKEECEILCEWIKNKGENNE